MREVIIDSFVQHSGQNLEHIKTNTIKNYKVIFIISNFITE